MSQQLTNIIDSTFSAAEQLTSMDNGWSPVVANALGTPLILREVFEHFASTELLELSLGNKQWLYEARRLMKNRDCFTAALSIAALSICLENVRTLHVDLNFDSSLIFRPNVWKCVKSFHFTRIFPNLSKVRTGNSCKDFELVENFFTYMADPENPWLVQPAPDRAVKIQKLIVSTFLQAQKYPSNQLLAQMFPNIQKLEILTHQNPFTSIWDGWPDLKEIHVKFLPHQKSHEELDSIFCGIFPQEAAHLRGQDEDYLRSVNVVPVMPSITSFKQLRSFKLESRAFFLLDGGGSLDEPKYLLTNVTGLIAFRRCPALAVTLTTDRGRLDQALSKIKPYASVILDELSSSSWDRQCSRW